MRPFLSHLIFSVLALVASILLQGTLVHAQVLKGIHSLYLCTYCTFENDLENDAFLATQLAFSKAEQDQMIAVGGGAIPSSDPKYEPLLKFGKDGLTYQTYLETEALSASDRDSKEHMVAAIRTYFEQIDATAPLTVLVSDHGWNGSYEGPGSLPPENAGVALREQRSYLEGASDLILNYQDFGTMLEEAKLVNQPHAPPLRIVTEACYGGGVHYLAEKYSNICTVSTTSSFETAAAADRIVPALFNYVADQKLIGPSPDLSEAFFAAWSIPKNTYSHGGALSSTQFVRNQLVSSGWTPQEAEKIGDQTLFQWNEQPSYKEEGSYDPIPHSLANQSWITGDATLPKLDLARAKKILNSLFPCEDERNPNAYALAISHLDDSDRILKDQSLIAEYKSLYLSSLKSWKNTEATKEKEESATSTSSLGNLGDFLSGQFKKHKQEKLAAFQEQMDHTFDGFIEFKKNHSTELRAVLKDFELVHLLNQFEPFAIQADQGLVTSETLDTLKRMVDCEALPL